MFWETLHRVVGLLFWAAVALGLLAVMPSEPREAEHGSAAAGASLQAASAGSGR